MTSRRHAAGVRSAPALAVLLWALPLAAAPLAAPPAGRIAPEVEAALAGGPADVIVHLDHGGFEHRPLVWPDGSDASAPRREAVRAVLDQFLGATTKIEARGVLEIGRAFTLQPALAARVDRAGLAALLEAPEVRHVELDRRWTAHTSEGLAVIGADVLHGLGYGGRGRAVAVIDTGVDYLHPSLGGALLPNLKVVRGLDTADLDDDPMDCGTHGTAVASIAVGSSYQWNPHRSFAGGVAPEATLLAYKASPDAACGTFLMSDVIAAIEDATLHRHGDDWTLAAINLSLGGDLYAGPCDSVSPAYALAVDDATTAGIAVVASAGNAGATDAIEAPACFSNVISVGSVWDTDSGFVGYSFCLDAGCSATCSDDYRPAGAVTCYTNSSPGLDVLGPSEFLTVARAGSTTAEFGGTSGAAPYVAGALALLAEARPELDPPALRALLRLTGQPGFDRRNGVVVPVVDVPAAAASAATGVGRPASVTIPAGGTPVVSTAFVGENVQIGSVRIGLRIAHDHPDTLLVRLRSPDGTTVRLHDRGPGTIPDPDGSTRFGGLFATYPDPDQPVDPLAALSGHSARGTWTLEVVDLAPPAAAVSTPPRLLDWAVEVVPASPPPARDPAAIVVPVIARGPGAQGTLWTTEVRMLNPDPDRVVRATAWYLPAAPDGSAVGSVQDSIVIPPGGVWVQRDVLRDRFGAGSGSGQLVVRPQDGAEVQVMARIATASDTAGSFGQGVAVGEAAAALDRSSGSALLLRLEESDAFRSNLGISEIAGAEVTVEVQLACGTTGEAHGPPLVRTLAPHGHLQLDRVLRLVSAEPEIFNAAAVVRVVGGEGAALAYGSVIDNATGDAVYLPARVPTFARQYVLPVVARTDGRAGTHWNTDLRVASGSSQPVDMRFELYHSGAGGPLVETRTVDPGFVFEVNDLLADMFGLGEGIGSLRIGAANDLDVQAVVTARVFNQTASGTYGQRVSPVESGAHSRLVLGFVEGGAGFRTNVGIAEIDGAPVTVLLTVLRPDGTGVAGERIVPVAGHAVVQVDDVLEHVAVPPLDRGWVELTVADGDGAIHGYASVVDHTTGDAVFLDAVPVSSD